MKLIIAIIQTHRLEAVKEQHYKIDVKDDDLEPTIEAIIAGARSGDVGEIGDGKIFVLPMSECVRIRTGERGSTAIG